MIAQVHNTICHDTKTKPWKTFEEFKIVYKENQVGLPYTLGLSEEHQWSL